MFSFLERLSVLEKRVDEILKDKIAVTLKTDTLKTDFIFYKDVTGEAGAYRRIGNKIEFTADYPPCGINIKTNTLIKLNHLKTAEVIGWETNTVFLQNEIVAAKINFGLRQMDTHNFVDIKYRKVTITAPMSGAYIGTFEIPMRKGGQIKIYNDDSDIRHLTIEKK